MVLISVAQTADLLRSAFARTNITKDNVTPLVQAGRLTNVSTGRSIRLDLAEVQDFIAKTRPVTPADWPTSHRPYRVSVIELRADQHALTLGATTRTHLGVEYVHRTPLAPHLRELAWTGVWQVSPEVVAEAVDARAILFATTKGYIGADYVRQIVGAQRTADGVWWDTAPAPANVRRFVGSGLWMDVPPGAKSAWA